MGTLQGREFVTYFRVSTKGQARDGWGLPAQRDAVAAFITRHGGQVAGEFQDVESGRKDSRPGLVAAIAAARATGAVLLVAKLDRLMRSLSLLALLRDAKVEFIAADMPDASELTVSILVAVAEHELRLISARTKAGLAAARARGVKLGTVSNLDAKARAAGRATRRRQTLTRHGASNLKPLLLALRAQGMSLSATSRHLAAQAVKTPSGKGRWTASTVRRLLALYAA